MRHRTLLVLAFAVPCSLTAQTPAAHSAPDAVMMQFEKFADIFGGRLVAAFDSIPASRYEYSPTPVQQTIGYIAQHVENANYSLCELLAAHRHPATAKDSLADTVKAHWPKDTLVARLRASLRYCDTAMESLGPLRTPGRAANLLAFETDLAEHYSQLSTYMRLLGLVPPSALTPRERTAIELPASRLAQYVGTYSLAPLYDVHVTMGDGKLWVRSSGGATVRLWPESTDAFFIREVDAQISFTRDTSGAVAGLIVHQYGRDRTASRIR